MQRTEVYTPSIEELRSYSFESYIRRINRKRRKSDGVTKITLPANYWSKKGIGKDETGRGPKWRKGAKLGDMEIKSPISQHCSGKGGVFDFEMVEQRALTVAAFRDKADAYKAKMIRRGKKRREVGGDEEAASRADPSDDGGGAGIDEGEEAEALDELAKQFWKGLGPTMDAPMYGADMEGTLYNGEDACGWNVDRLDSCLQLLMSDRDDDVALPGVTSAYLYFGMWGATFAAHTEDMNLLSINILHAGEPKYWYSISEKDSARFEAFASSYFPEERVTCSEFLRHKKYLLSPTVLKNAGIDVKTTIQRAGDAIITWPNCYHFGFNTGFNVAESTNFAIPEWIPQGRCARVCMCVPFSVRIGMQNFESLLREYEEETGVTVWKEGEESGKVEEEEEEEEGDNNKNDNKDKNEKEDDGIGYSAWAKARARKRRNRILSSTAGEHLEDHNDLSEKLAMKSLSSGIVMGDFHPNGNNVVLVAQMAPKLNRWDASVYNIYQWKKATAGNKKTFRSEVPVLCLSASKDVNLASATEVAGGREDVDGGHMWFEGSVIEIAEGHVRVHFNGLKTSEDQWFQLGSPFVMLDKGPVRGDEIPKVAKSSMSKAQKPPYIVVKRTRSGIRPPTGWEIRVFDRPPPSNEQYSQFYHLASGNSVNSFTKCCEVVEALDWGYNVEQAFRIVRQMKKKRVGGGEGGGGGESKKQRILVPTTTVQCDKCKKWRKIPTSAVDSLPEEWHCSMNAFDLAFANCDAPEEKWVEGDTLETAEGLAGEGVGSGGEVAGRAPSKASPSKTRGQVQFTLKFKMRSDSDKMGIGVKDGTYIDQYGQEHTCIIITSLQPKTQAYHLILNNGKRFELGKTRISNFPDLDTLCKTIQEAKATKGDISIAFITGVGGVKEMEGEEVKEEAEVLVTLDRLKGEVEKKVMADAAEISD